MVTPVWARFSRKLIDFGELHYFGINEVKNNVQNDLEQIMNIIKEFI